LRTLLVARHGESEASVLLRLNGDPTVRVGLTALGREQARALGETAGPVDLVAHSEFLRTKQTAELAWPGTPTLVVPELNETRFGSFEGTLWDDGYGEWVGTAGPDDECPGGGESRVAALRRYLRGFRVLLERPEERLALVGHGAQIRYLLLARDGVTPTPLLEMVELAKPNPFSRDELAAALERLDAWVASPAW
jgi:alpha-ribazole phosphatase